MSRYLCNLIVPGFGKSGTSSLHNYLDVHPSICMSRSKEPHFFTFDDRFAGGASAHNALFAHANGTETFYGESSTTYAIYRPAIERIARSITKPRIILLLRHPLKRILSHYRWLWAAGLENRPFLKAVREEMNLPMDPMVNVSGCYACYLLESTYSTHVQMMRSLLGEENIMILQSERLADQPQETLDRVWAWLGLPSCTLQERIEANATDATGVPRTLGLKALWHALPKSLRDVVDPDRKMTALGRRILGTRKRQPAEIPEAEIREVENLLTDEIGFFKQTFPA